MTPGDLDVATRTVWGEARGETQPGKEAVAHVILNRWRDETFYKAQHTITLVCQWPKQFSCWNKDDVNLQRMLRATLDDRMFRASMQAVLKALDAPVDPTYGSMHYHTSYVSPMWSQGKEPVAVIGGHFFFNDIG